MNLNQYLETIVGNYPDKTAIKYKGKEFSYRELLDRVCRLSNAMKKLGIEKGDVVGVVSENNNCYIEIIYACARIGAVSAHYNWRLHHKNTFELIENANVRLLFVSGGNMDTLEYAAKNSRKNLAAILIADGGGSMEARGHLDYEELIRGESNLCPALETMDDDVVQYLYTSGTTSTPKTVMRTNKSIISHSLIGSIELGIKSDDVLVHVLPMFHSTIAMVYCTLVVGGTVVILDRYDTGYYLDAIQNEKATISSLIPVLLDCLTRYPNYDDYDLTSLDTMVYAGAPMSFETYGNIKKMMDCDMFQVYGITEMGPSVAILKPQQHMEFLSDTSFKRLPVGKAILGTSIRIVKQDGSVCKPFEKGEITARSDSLMKGYMDEDLTLEAVRDGWFHTGDIGYMDEENYLYLSDRKNHMIISGGENIYPAEVEDCIRNMGKGILDVAVVGVPDESWGEIVKAIVVKSDKCNQMINEKEVIRHCSDNIASYKKPRSVEFWDKLPRNQSGKLQKNIIKEMIKKRESNTL